MIGIDLKFHVNEVIVLSVVKWINLDPEASKEFTGDLVIQIPVSSRFELDNEITQFASLYYI